MPFDVDDLVNTRVKVALLKGQLLVAQDEYNRFKLNAELGVITKLGPDGLGANKEIRDRTLAGTVEVDAGTREALTRVHDLQSALWRAEAELDGLRDVRRQMEYEQRERLGDVLAGQNGHD